MYTQHTPGTQNIYIQYVILNVCKHTARVYVHIFMHVSCSNRVKGENEMKRNK